MVATFHNLSNIFLIKKILKHINLLKLRKEGLDTSNFVPKGNWKEKCKMKQKKR